MIGAVQRSLSWKILIATGGTLVVLLGVFTGIADRETGNAIETLERRSSATLAGVVHKTLLVSMREGRMDDLQRTLQYAGGSVGVDSIRVVSPEGVVRYSSKAGERGARLGDERLLALVSRAPRAGEGVEEHHDGLVFSAVPLRNPERGECHECHRDEGPNLGSIVVGFDLSEFHQRLDANRRRQLLGALLLVLSVVAVIYLCVRFLVLRPLFGVVAATQRMAHGDLSQPLPVAGKDEMAALALHVNTMRADLRERVRESSSVADALAEAVAELETSSEQLVSVAVEQSSGAAEQASAVQEATTTSEEIAATSNEISANVEAVERVAEETYRASVQGREAVRMAVGGMADVKEQVRRIADAMVGLGKRSQKIGGIVDIIDEISEQTHLVALNAAIEAAGAGEHGKRFSVVAAEIRRLAERTVEATGQIKTLVEEIQESTNETVMATEKGSATVIEGAGRVDKIGESLDGVLSLVRQTKESTKEITVATQQQATAGEQLVLTITDINEVAVQVTRSAEQVEKSVLRLKDLARRLKDLAEENRAARKFVV
jgi:methyl-accepting chemotaxis protein